MNHRRTGKIARLPAEIREQVNEYISQGWEYSRIIDWLTQQGHPNRLHLRLIAPNCT